MGDYMREIEFWHRQWSKNMPYCRGYGEMKGKCDNFPIRGSEYCPECFMRMLNDKKMPDESQIYGIDCRDGKCEM